MDSNICIFSFFSGAGILDLAFEECGFKIVFVNEYNNEFLNSYKYSRASLNSPLPKYGYSNKSAVKFVNGRNKRKLISLVNQEKQNGNLVGFIGGPPCPDFSVGGKNAGSKGANGRLTKTYFDLICKCKPDFFLFENVKGLVRTSKHLSFYNEMKTKVKASGYLISDKVLNALSYGVPQFRERVFMVGLKKDGLKARISSDELDFSWHQYQKYDIDELLNLDWPQTQRFIKYSKRLFKYNIPVDLTVEHWFQRNNVREHQNAKDSFKVKQGKAKIESIEEGNTKSKSFKRLHRWRFSPTAAYGNNEVHLHPYRARRITVSEAMAIQSLPAAFKLPPNVSLSSKFKMIGNGVPFLMAKAIAKTLRNTLETLY